MMLKRRALWYLVAVVCLFGVTFGLWWSNADEPIETIGARPIPKTTAPRPPDNQNFVSFFALGDTGATTTQRRRVIEQMAAHAHRTHLQFVMLLGDNFYDDGVMSIDDHKWQTEFEIPFANAKLKCPFFVALGNHDHRGSTLAQIKYSQVNPRWNMPDAYYSFEKPIVEGVTAEFFVLDTQPIHADPEAQSIQLQWFRDQLAASTAKWKIVAAHHPVLSGGHHGRSENVANVLTPLFAEFNVDLYMSGHDHDLQLLDSNQGWLQLVSGAGSSLRTVNWTDATHFAEATGGFAWVLMTPERLSIEFIGTAGHRYTHHLTKSDAVAQRSFVPLPAVSNEAISENMTEGPTVAQHAQKSLRD